MHTVVIVRSAEKFLLSLSQRDQARLLEKMVLLGGNPRPWQAKKLKDHDDEYRMRVGEYRILYTIDDKAKLVRVGRIDRRSESTYK